MELAWKTERMYTVMRRNFIFLLKMLGFGHHTPEENGFKLETAITPNKAIRKHVTKVAITMREKYVETVTRLRKWWKELCVAGK